VEVSKRCDDSIFLPAVVSVLSRLNLALPIRLQDLWRAQRN